MKKSNITATVIAIIIVASGAYAFDMFTSSGYGKINGNIYGPLSVDGNYDCTGSAITCTITVDGQHATAYNTAANANTQNPAGILKRN